MIPTGNFSPFKTVSGVLREYTSAPSPLILRFEFNPHTITRTRSLTLRAAGASGAAASYDFENESEVPRVAQGVATQPESMTARILLDSTDRMDAGDRDASRYGIQPEIDIIRTMLEPKAQSPAGVQTLAALGAGDQRAFSRQQFASVLMFEWGEMTVPVFLTQAQVEAKEYLPNLFPYRAEVTLTFQVIESNNPIYKNELRRQQSSAGRRSDASGRG